MGVMPVKSLAKGWVLINGRGCLAVFRPSKPFEFSLPDKRILQGFWD